MDSPLTRKVVDKEYKNERLDLWKRGSYDEMM